MTKQTVFRTAFVAWMLAAGCTQCVGSDGPAEFFKAPDLNPVKFVTSPKHEPVTIVQDGKAGAVVYVAVAEPTESLKRMVSELVEVIRLSTGAELKQAELKQAELKLAELKLAEQMPPAEQSAIVIGDCEASRQAGIDATQIPVEGFVVKTARQRVYLVGSSREYPSSDANESTTWAVVDFLERFAGVRWYWPAEAGGRSIIESDSLIVPAVHYTDAPVFQYRQPWPTTFKTPQSLAGMPKAETLHPPLVQLRAGGSWPWTMGGVHSLPVNAQRTLGSQELLDYVLKGCAEVWDKNNPTWPGLIATSQGARFVQGDAVYVSYLDHRLQPEHVSQQRQQHLPTEKYPYVWKSASLVMGMFVRQLAEEVQKRWPDKRVVYQPYWDYVLCPDIDFPDNLEIQLCITHTDGMPGMTEPRKRSVNDNNIRAWHEKAGGKITLWNYVHTVRTDRPAQFPFLIQEFHRSHRERLAGSFINGVGSIKEWSTLAPSMHVYMKVLWNPDVNVQAILDELCRRQFGKAAETTRELLQLMIDRWEKTRWSVNLSEGAGLSRVAVR